MVLQNTELEKLPKTIINYFDTSYISLITIEADNMYVLFCFEFVPFIIDNIIDIFYYRSEFLFYAYYLLCFRR